MKQKKTHRSHKKIPNSVFFLTSVFIGLLLVICGGLFYFEKVYAGKVYPHVFIGNEEFSGMTASDVKEAWEKRNTPFKNLAITFQFENHVATVSGNALDIGFDASLSATQAVGLGRSGVVIRDLVTKYKLLTTGVKLEPLFTWREEVLDTTLNQLAGEINVEPENALFEFQNGRVVAFKLSLVLIL